MDYIRRRDRIIIKLPKVTDFYVCTLVRKENDRFYVKLDRGDYFSFKNKDLIVERAIERNCPELITIERLYDYILGIGDKEGHINKPETEEILKRISSEQEIQKQAIVDKKEMKESEESKGAKSIVELKKKKYEDGEEVDDSVEIEEEPEEVESEDTEELDESSDGSDSSDEESEAVDENDEELDETDKMLKVDEELDETDKMLKVDEEVEESDSTESKKEEVNPEVELEENIDTEELKKSKTEEVDESKDNTEEVEEPKTEKVDESEGETPKEEVDESVEVEETEKEPKTEEIEESKDSTEEVDESVEVEEPEDNTKEVGESEEEIPEEEVDESEDNTEEEEVDESVEVEETEEEPTKKVKVKSNFPLTDEDNVSELIVCDDNRNKDEGDLAESIYSTVMLQAARSFEKGDRLIIRAKGTLTFYLATVTMNRKGLIYLLLDKGDKLSLKPSSSLIMGFGKQKLCKYAINKNQLHRFMVKPFNALSKIQNLSNRKKMSPKELHESVKEYIPEKQNNVVPYKVVEQKEKLKNVGPYPVKEKKDFVKYLSPLTDSEIDEMIK